MSRQQILLRLWWKEFRILWQLVACLFLMTLVAYLLFALFALSELQQTWAMQMTMVIALPGFFAVGAGAQLVGKEKDTLTLDWLKSLPLRPNDTIRTKLLASLLTLVVLWIASVTIQATASALIRNWPSDFWSSSLADVVNWALFTSYLLVAGMTIAWAVESTFVGMFALVPFAALPPLTALIISNLQNGKSLVDLSEINPIWSTTCHLIGLGIALFALVRFGNRHLHTQTVVVSDRSMPSEGRDSWIGKTSLSPAQALIRHSIAQNRLALIAALFLIVAACIASAAGLPIVGAGIVALVCSWMGVLAFHADGRSGHVRFLAERGVSPGLCWISRQLVPAILCLLAVTLTVACTAELNSNGLTISPWVLLSNGLIAAGIVYATSQWVGQVVASKIQAFIAAPLLSLAALWFISFQFLELRTPVWLSLLVAFLPTTFTILCMRLWMDGRQGITFWSYQAIFLLLLVFLPTTPWINAYFRHPGMTADTRRVLESAIETYRQPREVVLLTNPTLVNSENLIFQPTSVHDRRRAPGVGLEGQINLGVAGLVRQVEQDSMPTRLGYGVLQFLSSELALTRKRLELEPKQSEVRHYRAVFDVCVQLAGRTRQSLRLRDQDDADLLEILLLNELSQPSADELLEEDARRKAVAMLQNERERQSARIGAIASSFDRFDDETGRLGGYTTSFLGGLSERRRIERITQNLYQLATSDSMTEDTRAALANEMQVAPSRYGLGTIPGLVDSSSSIYFAVTAVNQRSYLPGRHWNTGWEKLALQLRP